MGKSPKLDEIAYELHGVLTGTVRMITGKKVALTYGGGHESFLAKVVTPIYKVVEKEAKKNKNGTADYSLWRNYDDLKEFLWSLECFQIGWPMRPEHDFFCAESLDSSKPGRCRGVLDFASRQRKHMRNWRITKNVGEMFEMETV